MYKKKKTYEIEVHLGLLVLVVIMLCLNIASNYVIYNAKNILIDDKLSEMYNASLPISRYIQNNKLEMISEKDKLQFVYKYKLNDLLLIPSTPKEFTDDAKLRWLSKILYDLPKERIPIVSKVILTSGYYTLTRGGEDDYHYIIPVNFDKKKYVLILSKDVIELAYFDDALEILVNLSMVTIFSILLIYMLLYRFILSPFKKLKKDANLAGRQIPDSDYEVNSIIDEFQNIIKELKTKEVELVRLHKQETSRADSFEQFNIYLLDSMQAGIILIDSTGVIQTINKASEKICHIQSDRYHKCHYNELPFFSGKIKKQIAKTLQENLSHPYEECKLKHKSLQVGLLISPIHENETKQVGASILINDISEIKKLQNEVEKNRQMSALGEMSAGLAHQLRNSLGAIVGYNKLVKKRLTQHNLDTTTVDSMVTELQESENLIKRFLNFTKPFDYAPEDENVAEFIEDLIDTLKVRNDFSHINIQFNSQVDSETLLQIDKLLLKQAITNIIENCKNAYKNQSGTIEISLSIKNDTVMLITIEDTACGIESDAMDKIFTPFYSTNPSGTGLGLPLAQKIIVLHNGQVEVVSTVGVGTKFSISIPVSTKLILEKPITISS